MSVCCFTLYFRLLENSHPGSERLCYFDESYGLDLLLEAVGTDLRVDFEVFQIKSFWVGVDSIPVLI